MDPHRPSHPRVCNDFNPRIPVLVDPVHDTLYSALSTLHPFDFPHLDVYPCFR